MADARRLLELGMVPILARELANQITSGVGDKRRLLELTMVPRLASEVATQISIATPDKRRLVELGMVPRLALEVYTQIQGGGGIETETTALIARFTTQPTSERLVVINNLIKALKAAGVWIKIDALWLMAAADSQAARLNWVADRYNLQAVSAPTFVIDRGYAGDGFSSYLDSGFNAAAAAGKYTLNSAAIGIGDRTSRLASTGAQIGVAGANSSQIITRNTGNVLVGRLNEAGGGGDPGVADSSGRFIVSRTDAMAFQYMKNGVSIGIVSRASSAIPNASFFLCCRNDGVGTPNNFTSDQLWFGFISSGLTEIEARGFDAAILAYAQAVGAA